MEDNSKNTNTNNENITETKTTFEKNPNNNNQIKDINKSNDEEEISAQNKAISIYLMGDSIFDNAPYVQLTGTPEVIQQLWKKTQGKNREYHTYLTAFDGDVLEGIPRQKKRIPADADFIFISIGGNDLLRLRGKLDYNGYTFSSVWNSLSWIRNDLYQMYEDMVKKLIESHPKSKIVLSTIYSPLFSTWTEKTLATTALWFFNNFIKSIGTKYKLPVLDIASMFTKGKDYANPIEPSSWGGDKITSAMMDIIEKHDFSKSSQCYYQLDYTSDSLSLDKKFLTHFKDKVYKNRNYSFITRKTEENDPYRQN